MNNVNSKSLRSVNSALYNSEVYVEIPEPPPYGPIAILTTYGHIQTYSLMVKTGRRSRFATIDDIDVGVSALRDDSLPLYY